MKKRHAVHWYAQNEWRTVSEITIIVLCDDTRVNVQEVSAQSAFSHAQNEWANIHPISAGSWNAAKLNIPIHYPDL